MRSRRVSNRIYEYCGVKLQKIVKEGKSEMKLNLSTFDSYIFRGKQANSRPTEMSVYGVEQIVLPVMF